jgi:ABC-type branched-subunit amino acid transport system substrate-binding protein
LQDFVAKTMRTLVRRCGFAVSTLLLQLLLQLLLLLVVLCWAAAAPAAAAALETSDYSSMLDTTNQNSNWCGVGTLYDATRHQCISNCDNAVVNDTDTIYIAGIVDTGIFPWTEELFNITVSLLNNRGNGFFDDIFVDSKTTTIEYAIANDDCDETAAAQAYWKMRRIHGYPIHGIVGSRCSGASISLARLASLEGVPQVSPLSLSTQLSNDEEFPYFSRLSAPNDERGGVGALVALLRSLGWSRVSIIATDTEYAKDTVLEFRKLWTRDHVGQNGTFWKGKVAYSNTVSLLPYGEIDVDSVRLVLKGVPTDDPTINSRVILLIAQEEQGFPILKVAKEMGFQKDTIWVGISWVARNSPIATTEWLPEYPGYLGIGAVRNHDATEQDFLSRVQQAQIAAGQQPWDELSSYAMAYLVDSIVVLVMALSMVPVGQRYNGTAVTQAITHISMNGVSGPVSFTETGDRANPLYAMYHYKKVNKSYDWVTIGTTGIDVSTTNFAVGLDELCFAEVGCNLRRVPSDSYEIPKPPLPMWVFVVLPVIAAMLLGLALKYWRYHIQHRATINSLCAMQQKMQELERINNKIVDVDKDVEDATRKKDELILLRGALLDKPTTWTNSNRILVEVEPDKDEYWIVSDQLQRSMKNANIAKLWRIQNSSLWSYYSFHKHRLTKNNIETNELPVWHGTSGMDPSVVYNDRQDGFMMQYSEKGFWGYVQFLDDVFSHWRCMLMIAPLVALQSRHLLCRKEQILARVCL